ncbi:hypothetical protein MKEN_00455900 [Mycena kentingensis (nom. inval.)]|nr:hypothetical protein MKEN_00455900 [Mycena kentingensis (nom. inval.)]
MLPQELLDLVVDNVPSSDRATLRACSRAFRGIAARARTRLLRSMQLTPITSEATAHTKGPKLLKLLESEREIGSLVQALHIVEGRDPTLPWIAKASRTLGLILPHLVNLRHFSLLGIRLGWSTLLRSFRSAINDVAPRLETLYLRGLELANPTDGREVCALFTKARNLLRLGIVLSTGSQFLPITPFCPSPPWTLQVIAFAEHWRANSTFKTLLSSANITMLHTLSLYETDWARVATLLQDLPAKNVVEQLNIWVYGSFSATPLGLARLNCLRSLRICSAFSYEISDLVTECSTVPSLERLTMASSYLHSFPLNAPIVRPMLWQAFWTAVKARPSTLRFVELYLSSQFQDQASARQKADVFRDLSHQAGVEDLVVRGDISYVDIVNFEDAYPLSL